MHTQPLQLACHILSKGTSSGRNQAGAISSVSTGEPVNSVTSNTARATAAKSCLPLLCSRPQVRIGSRALLQLLTQHSNCWAGHVSGSWATLIQSWVLTVHLPGESWLLVPKECQDAALHHALGDNARLLMQLQAGAMPSAQCLRDAQCHRVSTLTSAQQKGLQRRSAAAGIRAQPAPAPRPLTLPRARLPPLLSPPAPPCLQTHLHEAGDGAGCDAQPVDRQATSRNPRAADSLQYPSPKPLSFRPRSSWPPRRGITNCSAGAPAGRCLCRLRRQWEVPAGATGAVGWLRTQLGWKPISPLVLTVSSLGDMLAATQRTPGRCPFGAQRRVRAARLCDDNRQCWGQCDRGACNPV